MADLTRIGKMVKAPSKAKLKIANAAGDIHLDPATIEDACFYPAVLCQIGMPRRRTEELRWERRNGSTSLLLKAGTLWDGTEHVSQLLPYGAKPRLVIMTLTNEAIRRKERFIPIGRSMRAFMSKMGIDPQGSEYRSLRQQMKSLAVCQMIIGDTAPNGLVRTRNTFLVEEFCCSAWLTPNGEAQAPWAETMELSDTYFRYVQEHAVPLDERAVATLRGSALALDIYAWLAHRLLRVNEPNGVLVSWEALKLQFGQDYVEMKKFREDFRDMMIDVRALYPESCLEDTEEGVRLWESKPPIPTAKAPGGN